MRHTRVCMCVCGVHVKMLTFVCVCIVVCVARDVRMHVWKRVSYSGTHACISSNACYDVPACAAHVQCVRVYACRDFDNQNLL